MALKGLEMRQDVMVSVSAPPLLGTIVVPAQHYSHKVSCHVLADPDPYQPPREPQTAGDPSSNSWNDCRVRLGNGPEQWCIQVRCKPIGRRWFAGLGPLEWSQWIAATTWQWGSTFQLWGCGNISCYPSWLNLRIVLTDPKCRWHH